MIGCPTTAHCSVAFLALTSGTIRAAEPMIASMPAKESALVLLEAPLDAVLRAEPDPGLRDNQGGQEQQYQEQNDL